MLALLAAGAPTPAGADEIVVEVDGSAPGLRVISSPWNTLTYWRPAEVPPGTAADNPMIRTVCFFNATGGQVDAPENELYDEDTAGNPVYHFDRLTSKIDTVLAEGLQPYLTISSVPLKLASDPSAISSAFANNTSPPADWDRYYAYIQALFEQLDAVYGEGEVASWSYRFMTEQDNRDWWTGTMDEYFRFHDYTVSAARAANPGVVIDPGNYLGLGSAWIDAAAARVDGGIFSIPGEEPVVPRVLHISMYRPWSVGDASSPWDLFADVEDVRARLASYPTMAAVPVAIDEGYIGVDENDLTMYARLDGTELGGAHVALLTHVLVELEFSWGALWSTGSPQVPPPARNVINLFEGWIAGNLIVDSPIVSGTPTGENIVHAVAARPGGSAAGNVRVMLYNYNRTRGAADMETVRVRITDLPAAPVSVTQLAVDRDHGNYSVQWLADSAAIPRDAYGYELSPYDLNPLQGIRDEGYALWAANEAAYAELARVGVIMDGVPMDPLADGTLEISVDLPSHAVAFLVFEGQAQEEESESAPEPEVLPEAEVEADAVPDVPDVAEAFDVPVDAAGEEEGGGGDGGCGCRVAG
jgi:hypothetical protein